jgi:hypothetical protein
MKEIITKTFPKIIMKAIYIALSKEETIVESKNAKKTIDCPNTKKNLNKIHNSAFWNSGNPIIVPEVTSTLVCTIFMRVPTMSQLSQ